MSDLVIDIQFKADASKLKAVANDVVSEINKVAAAGGKATTSAGTGIAPAVTKIKTETQGLATVTALADKEVRKVGSTISAVATASKSSSTAFGSMSNGIKSAVSSIGNGFASIGRAVSGFSFGGRLQNAFSGLREEFDSFAGRIPFVGKAMVALGPVGTTVAVAMAIMGKSVVANTLYMERLEARLKGIVGSGGLKGAMDYVQAEAARSGQALDVVAGGYARFLTLQKSGILTFKEAQQLQSGINDAATVLGASNTQVEQTLFGLSQGLSSGTLRAEELNQIVEPMPGLLQAMDKAAGLAAGGFRRLTNDGKVSADMLRTTLRTALASYGDSAKESADMTDRAVQRMSNSWTNFTNAPWVRGIIQAGAKTAAAVLNSVSGVDETLDQKIADAEKRSQTVAGRMSGGASEEALNKLRAQKALIERWELRGDAAEKAARDTEQAKEGPSFTKRVTELESEAEQQDRLNKARIQGGYALMQETAAIEVQKRVKKEVDDLAKSGEKITDDKKGKIQTKIEAQVNTEIKGEFFANAAAETQQTEQLATAREKAAAAAGKGAVAQMAAARSAQVEAYAREKGAAAAEAYRVQLERIDSAELSGKLNQEIRSLEDQAAATDIVTAAIGKSAQEQEEAERKAYLLTQATQGLSNANGALERSYIKKQASEANQRRATVLADLNAETEATVRLADAVGKGAAAQIAAQQANFKAGLKNQRIDDSDGSLASANSQSEAAKRTLSAKLAIDDIRTETTATVARNAAVRDGNRERMRQADIEAEVVRWTKQYNLEASDPLVREYRLELTRRYSAQLEEEAQATQLAGDAAARYRRDLAELDEQRTTGLISDEVYTRRTRELALERLRSARDWKSGAILALTEYAEEAGNAAQNVGNVISNTMNGVEDVFVEWATTGKIQSADLFNQIIEDATRAAYRMAIITPIMNAVFGGGAGGTGASFGGGGSGGGGILGSLLGSLFGGGFSFGSFHTGGIVGASAPGQRYVHPSVFDSAKRYHSGGLVKSEVPLIAQHGEGIFTPRQMENADRLLGAALTSQPPKIEIQLHNNTSAKANVETTQRADGGTQIKLIVGQIESAMASNIQKNRGLAPSIGALFNLDAAPKL